MSIVMSLVGGHVVLDVSTEDGYEVGVVVTFLANL